MHRVQNGDGTQVLVGVADVAEEGVASDEVVEQEFVLFVEDLRCLSVNSLVRSQYCHTLVQDRVQTGLEVVLIIAVLIPDLADELVLVDVADVNTVRCDEESCIDALA